MSRKIYCLFILAMLAVSLTAMPSYALTFRYSDEASYDTANKLIHGVLSAQITEATQAARAELRGYNIYKAFIVVLQIMQESPIVADVEYPVVAPDQSLFFIPYFPEAKPNELHFIVLHRLKVPGSIALRSFDEQGFSEFTSERYQTRFHYVTTQKSQVALSRGGIRTSNRED